MTIDYRITLGEVVSETMLERVKGLVRLTFDEVNNTYNQWNPASEISALNRLKAGDKVAVSPGLYRLLLLANEIVKLSDGRYDPTIEPLRQLWIQNLDQGKIPSDQAVQAVSPQVGWSQIHLANGLFWKDHTGVQITLDSISKGHCVDLLLERLQQAGFANVLVEWGGEVRAAGRHPEGRPWRVFIRNLSNTQSENALAELDVGDEALATSGDYLQYWTVDSKTYTHIFNALERHPLTIEEGSIASVTVMAPTCALADGLATATMCFSTTEQAKAWAERAQSRFPNATFWLATRSIARGDAYFPEGIAAH